MVSKLLLFTFSYLFLKKSYYLLMSTVIQHTRLDV